MSNKKVYLVAYYYMRPKHQRVRTETAGWMNNQENVTWDEQISLTTKLKDRDLTTAKVILNLTERNVVINGWTGNKDFDELFDHFYKHYRRDMQPVVEQLGYFKPAAEQNIDHTQLPMQTVDTSHLVQQNQNETISSS